MNADLALAGAQTLMLSLDGQMRYLPMAALHDGNHYLAERYALAIHTDAVKANLAQRPARTWRVSGLGLTRAMDGFSALPAVKQEIKGILASSASGGKAHFDQEFTSERLQNSLRSARKVLHISSHFVFNWGTDTDSYLLLGDGSRLSLRDIREARYDFSALDLLTLSACNTAIGGGKDAEGREVEGLGVMAQRQGAKAVLASLWPVADDSTSLLMRHLYRYRTQNPDMTKAEALRQAQLAVMAASRKEASGRYAHPYFWAPFILMGNWL